MLFYRPASQRISDGLERPDADKNNWWEPGARSALLPGGFGSQPAALELSMPRGWVPGQRRVQPV